MDFETWFRAEVIADRLYGADEDVARRVWTSALMIAAEICDQHAERSSDDEAYSVGMACAGDIRELAKAPD